VSAAADQRDIGGPAQPLLIARNLAKHFAARGAGKAARVRAVDDVSFTLFKGETLGIVGESGCGKSTLARLLLHLLQRDSGELIFDGEPVGAPRGITVAALRRNVQMIFQDSYSSLNPRMPVQDSVAFGPFVHGRRKSEARRAARDMLVKVGLNPDLFGPRYSARTLRWPEAAGEYCAGAGDRAAHGDPGRSGLGARQVGGGAGS
jgi:peptide/nickel transport system ATP-binding protein